MSDTTTLPSADPLDPRSREILEQWAPRAQIRARSLGGGRSGSNVFVVTIAGGRHSTPRGEFVFKISPNPPWEGQASEIEAHLQATHRNPSFARQHIPRLRKFARSEDPPLHAMLYDPAGHSLDSYIAASEIQVANLAGQLGSVVRETLVGWAAQEPVDELPPHQLLESWLGYRLEEGSPLRQFFDSTMVGSATVDVGRVRLPNPLAHLLEPSRTEHWPDRYAFKGLLHGDLHPANILLQRASVGGSQFFLVDFALSHEGYLGYDQAYTELGLLLTAPEIDNEVSLLNVLENAAASGTSSLPRQLTSMRDHLRIIRAASTEWIRDFHPNWSDSLNRQFSLARIAVGLNWVNKELPIEQRRMALVYAASSAQDYLQSYQPAALDNALQKISMGTSWPTRVPSPTDNRFWEELWQFMGGYDSGSARFILVSEAQPREASVPFEALGRIPWSVVIDLDPQSEVKGLLSLAGNDLRLRRGLHVIKGTDTKVEFDRGTAWLLAAGNQEQPLLAYSAWRLEKPQLIRTVIEELEVQSNPLPLRVLVLRGGHIPGESAGIRVGRVLTEVFEASRGRAEFRVLGPNPAPDIPPILALPFAVETFVATLAATYGTASTKRPTIPSGAGGSVRCEISIEILRSLEENFDLLHSAILEEERLRGEGEPGAFWRGSPPTWSDLEFSLDVEREVHAELLSKLIDRLDNRARGTVTLHHQPGSGGTTAALRAAWALHRLYPTTILRRYSGALPSRLHTLFVLSQRPILLVAEASVLPDSSREELYRALAQQGTGVVVLYVERELGVREDATGIRLFDPLSPAEAESFRRTFSKLTAEPHRQEELARITRIEELDRYRTPFFYGLITYERDFTSIERYVTAHLAEMPVNSPREIRRLLEYLALVTIYSDAGLPLELLPRLLGVSEKAELSLDDLVGPGPARLLVVSRRSVRILHQVLAEEVLDYFSGGQPGSWRRDLRGLATDFIRGVTEVIDPDSVAVRELFRQLFVNRLEVASGDADETSAFAPLIEDLDQVEPSLGHQVLEALTKYVPNEAHFWNHLGRHQVYRLKRDTNRAEQYLLRAIQLSDDYVHYHTLGVVLRSRVQEIARSLKTRPPEEILEAIKPDFLQAAEAFASSRERNPENIYAYVTHVQLIVGVAHQLIRAAGAKSAATIGEEALAVRAWLAEQIPLAEALLEVAQRLYGTLYTPDRYITECYASLRRVYGDLDEVVRLWEIALAQGLSSLNSRRALARAYLARRDRQWRRLSRAELARVRDLMELNLRTQAHREEDLELWFHAARLLPDFNIDEALALFHTGSVIRNAYRAPYYSYILRFILWFQGRTEHLDEMLEAIDISKASFVGRRGVSLEWLGRELVECPLVSESELGTWNRERNFWENDDLLRRVNGVIDESTDRVQAGYIRIGGRAKAFFVPTVGGFGPEDKNAQVNFFLGFSLEGLRAWEVRRGHVEGADRRHVGEPAVEVTFGVTPELSETELEQRASKINRERVTSFVGEVVKALSEVGAEIELGALNLRVQAALGWNEPHIIDALGEPLLSYLIGDSAFRIYEREGLTYVDAASSSPRHESKPRLKGVIYRYQAALKFGEVISEDGQRFLLDSASVKSESHRQNLRPNLPVKFTARGTVARDVSLLPVPSQEELVGLTKDRIWKIMQKRAGRRKRVSLAALERLIRITSSYEGRFVDAIGMPFEELASTLADLEVREVEGRRYLQYRGPVAFGRLQPQAEAPEAPDTPDTKPTATREGLVNMIRNLLQELGPTSLQRIGVILHKRAKVSNRTFRDLGFKSFGDFVRKSRGLATSGDGIVSVVSVGARVNDKQQTALAGNSVTRVGARAEDLALATLKVAALEHTWQAGQGGVNIAELAKVLERLPGFDHKNLRHFLARHSYKSLTAFLRSVSGLIVTGPRVSLRPPEFFDERRLKEQEKMLAVVLSGLIQKRAPESGKLRAEAALRVLERALGVRRIDFERFGYQEGSKIFINFVEHIEGLSVLVRDEKAWVQLRK